MTREEALKDLQSRAEKSEALKVAIKALEQEPKIGTWVVAPQEDNWDAFYCSSCKRMQFVPFNYCPSCGSKNEKVVEGENNG